MKVEMREFYRGRVDLLGSAKVSKLGRGFKITRLGGRHSPCLNAKAKQTRDLLPFVCEQLEKHRRAIRGWAAPITAAARHLQDFYAYVSRDSRAMAPHRLAGLEAAAWGFIQSWAQAEGHPVPKLHYFVHLVEQARTAGNPAFFTTYVDEGFNRQVKKLARSVHGARFSSRVLAKHTRARQ